MPFRLRAARVVPQLCESLLGSCVPDRNFKRFNLSEFSHPSKFNRLTGGDPNYVGDKEGGECVACRPIHAQSLPPLPRTSG